jgi:hypothetical protein
MISVELRGGLKAAEQLRLLRIPVAARRRIMLKVGRATATEFKRTIRRHVRQATVIYPDPAERASKARFYSRTVGWKATPDQAVIFDKGLARNQRLEQGATEAQAKKMRQHGFKLSVGYIQRHFTVGLAGLILRELESGLRQQRTGRGLTARAAPKRKKRESRIVTWWGIYRDEVLATVDVPGIIRRELQTR